MSSVGQLGLKSVSQGAATQVYVAVHPAAAALSGRYFADSNVAASRPDGDDAELAKKLWDTSETIVGSI